MSIFKGSGVALITPFKENGEIDFETLKNLVEFQIENGTDSIIICGTTGESSTLNDEEHIKCIEACVKYVNGRIPVIAGTGSNDTKTAVMLSKEAEKVGADGLLCVTPYYNKTSQDGLKRYYGKIAESVDIPIIMYNVPPRTGMNITLETMIDIAKNNSNIVAIKEASGNISAIAKILASNALDVYSGNDDQTVPILSLGGIGVISVVANIFPKEMHNMVMDYLNGNVEQARDMQLKMIELCNALFCDVNPIPVKKTMEILGMANGYIREPLIELDNDKTKILTKAINNFKNN
ncbi:MAG: 4-hydroxy-tetrahydrodipicolinate synthase [Bacilli bacterium]|nr:4-hydroxy-tetrahydrodipicolinate synthase [Bacilli bacterium]